MTGLEIIALLSSSAEVAKLITMYLPKIRGKRLTAEEVKLQNVSMEYISRYQTLNYSAEFIIAGGNTRKTSFWKFHRPRKPLYYLTLRNDEGFLTLFLLRQFRETREIKYSLFEMRPSLQSFGEMYPGEKVIISIPIKTNLDSQIKCNWNTRNPKFWTTKVENTLAIHVKNYLVTAEAPNMRLKEARRVVNKRPPERIEVDLEFKAKKGFPKEKAVDIDLSDLKWRDEQHITRDYNIVVPVDIEASKHLELQLLFE